MKHSIASTNRGVSVTSGFTIVEVVIIIVVIGILATIVSFTYVTQQQHARNSERAADTIELSEALEKYYDQKGEYPTCAMLRGDAQQVASELLVGLSADALRAPSIKTESTSIICSQVGLGGIQDAYSYIGDNSVECTNGSSCKSWTLSYPEEGTDQIIEIKSRRSE